MDYIQQDTVNTDPTKRPFISGQWELLYKAANILWPIVGDIPEVASRRKELWRRYNAEPHQCPDVVSDIFTSEVLSFCESLASKS